MRVTKHAQVLNHLKEHGSITSWDAIRDYGATRLSAIIFNLRKEGYNISTETVLAKDRNGNTCQFAKYTLEEDE